MSSLDENLAIGRTAVREIGASRHYGNPIKGPPWTLHTSRYYDIEGFKGYPILLLLTRSGEGMCETRNFFGFIFIFWIRNWLNLLATFRLREVNPRSYRSFESKRALLGLIRAYTGIPTHIALFSRHLISLEPNL